MYDKFSDGKLLYFEDTANAKSLPGPKHYHNVFEIYFMDSGECNYFIDNKLYHVIEGDIVLIPEGRLHRTMYGYGEHSRYLINCSRHFIPTEIMDKLPSLLHLYRNPTIVPYIRELFERIGKEYYSPDEYSENILLGLVHLLFYTLIRNTDSCLTVQPSNLYTSQAIAYIKDNYSSDISLSALAKSISVSPEHLSRIFKKETGFGFSEYVSMYRLQKAENMLKNAASERISDVAYACGFNDSNYFCEKFKQVYGFPPSQLLKLRRSALASRKNIKHTQDD